MDSHDWEKEIIKEEDDDDEEEALSPTDRWWIKRSLPIPTKTHTQTAHGEKRSDCLLRTGRETPKRTKNHTQNGPICRQHLPFVLFPLLLSYFVVLDLVITQTIQTPLSLYCYKSSPKNMIPPPFCQVKNLKISQSLMLSITHSLAYSLTNAFSWVIHQVQGGASCETKQRFRLDGFIPSLLPILSTTDNTSKKRQQKKEEEEKLNTHTHTHKERWFLIQRILHKNSVFFSNNNKMLHSNPEILHRNSSLWQLGLELIPWSINWD